MAMEVLIIWIVLILIGLRLLPYVFGAFIMAVPFLVGLAAIKIIAG